MTEGEPKKKFQIRIPVLSELATALKNTSDIKGAIQTTYGGIEVALVAYMLSTPESEVKWTAGMLAAVLAMGGLWAIDRHNLTKK